MKKIIILLLLSNTLLSYSQKVEYGIKRITANTKYSDFGVSFYGSNRVIYSSNRKDLNNKGFWSNGEYYLDLYEGIINPTTGDIERVKLFTKKESKYHESNICFTKDLRTVYFTRNNYQNNKFKINEKGESLVKLYRAKVGNNGKWKDIEPLPFNDESYQTGHPTLNEAEDKLYFISDMPGGYGETDIYVVQIYEDGIFGKPKNLGPRVNTSGKEMFPFVQGSELYYSSNGPMTKNYGGLDIYRIELDEEGFPKDMLPVNLEEPLNSGKDDFSIVFDKTGKKGYLSSNRLGGKGNDDIYFFYIKEEEKEEIIEELPCEQYVMGVVKNGKTKEILSGVSVSLRNALGVIEETQITGDKGEYRFKVKCNTNYGLVGSKEKYEEDKLNFITSKEKGQTQKTALLLYPDRFVEVRGKTMIDINPIYFDLAQSSIRPDAAEELTKVLEAMKIYPKLEIALGAHTDSRGRDAYNLKLSQRRARSAKNWLVYRGISPNRITAKGYGEMELLNRCSNGVKCTEEEHELNRRIEFVVKNPEEIKTKKL